jgi:hippurate hydrolase
MMASLDTFEIVVSGKGCHAAMPEEGRDVLLCASQIVVALQSIVSRRIAPHDAGVVSVTQIHGGEAWNVLPERAVIRGTVRCFSGSVQQRIRDSVDGIATGIASALGVKAALDYRYAYPATVNHPIQTDCAIAAAEATVGSSRVRRETAPSMASEDFAFMLQSKPGAYIWMGVDSGTSAVPLHNPHYDFNDAALPIGATYWVNVVKAFGLRHDAV